MSKSFIAGGFALCALLGACAAHAQLVISEFRVRGPAGGNDEFIEIYNASGANHAAAAAVTDGSADGYAIVASDGTMRCVIPNGKVIPGRGHFLCVNSAAYGMDNYPAGNGTTATGDATYMAGIADNAGIAIFNNSVGGADFSLANRMDAGSGTVTVTVPAAAAVDAVGNASTAAALIDNLVQFNGGAIVFAPSQPEIIPVGDRATWLMLAAATLLIAGLALTRRKQ